MNAPFAPAVSGRVRNVRVMVVDDSATIRGVFSRLIEHADGLELAAAMTNAEDALSFLLEERVDVILLDLEMPGMGGFEALPLMLERAREAKIMVVSSLTADGAEQTVRALNLGAADTLQKPVSGGFNDEYRENLLARIRALGKRPLRRAIAAEEGKSANASVPAPVLRPESRVRARLVVIGASTGGIHAIGQCLSSLPERVSAPILVTQHLPESFIPAFASKLAEVAGRPALIAEEGMPLLPNHIYVASGAAHLTIEDKDGRAFARMSHESAPANCVPAVDPMFASAAKIFGPSVLAIVLTGMGRDGTVGAGEIAAAGGTVIVQNEATSAVWGMPGSVVRAGFASAILHPNDIGQRIASTVR